MKIIYVFNVLSLILFFLHIFYYDMNMIKSNGKCMFPLLLMLLLKLLSLLLSLVFILMKVEIDVDNQKH